VLQFLSAARAAAATAHAAASTGAEVRLLGPVPAAMARRAGRHYAQLLLECAGRAPLHRFLTAWLPAVDALARQQHVRYGLDVDPLEIG
jgi:primosomal protein N' (replication factor Y)